MSERRLPHLQRGDDVLVAGEWYPVVGYALSHKPDAATTGSVFTLKPLGKFEPCLGYRISYADIEEVRRPSEAQP